MPVTSVSFHTPLLLACNLQLGSGRRALSDPFILRDVDRPASGRRCRLPSKAMDSPTGFTPGFNLCERLCLPPGASSSRAAQAKWCRVENDLPGLSA